MTPVDETSKFWPQDFRRALSQHGSLFRWCWKTRQLFRVNDVDSYEKRFARFWEFFAGFYEGIDLPLQLSADKHEDLFGKYYNLFELDVGKIAVAAFNSCYRNDCFAYQGDIPEEALARSHLKLQERGKIYYLKIATWHHNVEGPPQHNDYMDVDLIRRMIDKGYRLGLHGHQHKAEATPHYIHIPDEERMVVVSAGSLCAGLGDLPTGVNRQYNIIEIADDFQRARIHVREMAVSTVFRPSYSPAFGGKSYIDMGWTTEKNAVGKPIEPDAARIRSAVHEAEKAFHTKDYNETIQYLDPYFERLPAYGRQLLIEALQKSENWQKLIDRLSVPTTPNELTVLISAYAGMKQWLQARSTLGTYAEQVGLPEPNCRDLVAWLDAQQEIQE